MSIASARAFVVRVKIFKHATAETLKRQERIRRLARGVLAAREVDRVVSQVAGLSS